MTGHPPLPIRPAMLRLPAEKTARRSASETPATARTLAANVGDTYGKTFWFAYLANTSLMATVSLLFRYGDFVGLLGGTEFLLGLIVGVGMIGSLVMRLFQGFAIDRYGPIRIWLFSLVGVISTVLAHVFLSSATGPGVFAARVIYQTSIAGAFGASIAFISLRSPPERMAEMVGMLGSSGFVGMFFGTQLGDWLCNAEQLERWHLDRLFVVATAVAMFALLCARLATWDEVRLPRPKRRPPMHWIIRRYHPGALLLLALAMGVGVGLPGTFLRPYTESLGIRSIGVFFGVYSVTAFTTRILTRRVPDRIGVGRAALLGMAFLIGSMFAYLAVDAAWQLAFPGVLAGIAHALLFPSVVAGGSRTFPIRYRGLAVTLTLGTFDLGNLVGMPLAGAIAEHLGFSAMYVVMAVLLALFSTAFAIGGLRVADSP